MLQVKKNPNNPDTTRGTAAGTAPATYKELNDQSSDQASSSFQSGNDSLAAKQQTARVPGTLRPPEAKDFYSRPPAIVGEAYYTGTLQVDGMVSGNVGGTAGGLIVRQKSKTSAADPELSGEISFRDLVRVNGHVTGTIYSSKGTLIVDASARVEARVEVGVAVIGGTVYGDIVAHERVELGPYARMYGNIFTRSISVKNGAIFEGACKMIEDGHLSERQ
jgi:cytoskeletal protein CcmA (bactofilin family)